MTTPWIVAFAALAALVFVVALLVLGLLRRLAPLLERTEARLADVAHDLSPRGLVPGTSVHAFSAEQEDGASFTEAELRGEPTIVLFLGTACQACERLIDDLESNRVPDLGLRLVVATQDSDQARALAADPAVTVVTQRHRELARAFDSNVTPHAFVLDASGVVRASGTPNDWEHLRQLTLEAARGGEADSPLAAAAGSYGSN